MFDVRMWLQPHSDIVKRVFYTERIYHLEVCFSQDLFDICRMVIL